MDEDGDDPWDEFGEQGRGDEDELKRLVERDRDRDRVRDLDRYRRRVWDLERLVCSCCCGWPGGGSDRSCDGERLLRRIGGCCCGGSWLCACFGALSYGMGFLIKRYLQFELFVA